MTLLQQTLTYLFQEYLVHRYPHLYLVGTSTPPFPSVMNQEAQICSRESTSIRYVREEVHSLGSYSINSTKVLLSEIPYNLFQGPTAETSRILLNLRYKCKQTSLNTRSLLDNFNW